MACAVSASSAWSNVAFNTVYQPVMDWSGDDGLYVVRVHASTPVRCQLSWYTGDHVEEAVIFDVIGVATLVLPARRVKVEAYAHTATSRVAVAVVPTASWVQTEVRKWVAVSTGSTDSDVTAALKPPRHTDRVDIATDTPTTTFDLELFDESGDSIGVWDETTLPAGGINAARVARATITSDAPLRLTYVLKV